jgi:hypothetical protein
VNLPLFAAPFYSTERQPKHSHLKPKKLSTNNPANTKPKTNTGMEYTHTCRHFPKKNIPQLAQDTQTAHKAPWTTEAQHPNLAANRPREAPESHTNSLEAHF